MRATGQPLSRVAHLIVSSPFMKTAVGAIRRRIALGKSVLLELRHRHLKHAFTVTSHLTTEERVILSSLANGKAVVCEIGCYLGASACCFGAAMSNRGKGKILCIDTWHNEGMSDGLRDTYAEFIKNTAAYADFIIPLRGYSTQVLARVAQQASHIDLLFIDGDHSYDGVKADWQAYSHFLVPGSVVAFHDCGWAVGVKRVIEEDAKPRVCCFDSLPNLWWGTIGS